MNGRKKRRRRRRKLNLVSLNGVKSPPYAVFSVERKFSMSSGRSHVEGRKRTVKKNRRIGNPSRGQKESGLDTAQRQSVLTQRAFCRFVLCLGWVINVLQNFYYYLIMIINNHVINCLVLYLCVLVYYFTRANVVIGF
jgi:hypothetical protein